MTPLETALQKTIAKTGPDLQTIWTRRLLAGGAVYFLLGGREVRLVVAGGTIYYLVQKKIIQTETDKAIKQAQNSLEDLKNKIFGK